jgi:hypothetical protein
MDYAPYFDRASSERAELSAGLFDGNADNTICAWVRWASNANVNGLWKLSLVSGTSWQNSDSTSIRANGDLRIQSNVASAGAFDEYTPSTSLGSRWVHVASRRIGTALALFLDGVEVASVTVDVSARGAITYLSFARAETTIYYEGAMAGAMAWDHALTDAEILRQSQQMTPVVPAWGYWPWLETDESGNGRDLTVVGTVTRETAATATMPRAKWRNGPTTQAYVADAVAGSATLTAAAGAFTTTFQDAALLRQRRLAADVGAFVTTFLPATLTDSQGPPPSSGAQRLSIGIGIGI